jgi:fumarylacetoacetate (FAA) hydrolase family protein
MVEFRLDAENTLPADAGFAALAGRVWRPDQDGPSVVTIRDGMVMDVSEYFATMRDLCESPDPGGALEDCEGEALGPIDEILTNTPTDTRDDGQPWLLSPIDLQPIKAAGVTFAASMLERVIEERAKGSPEAAQAIRQEISESLGGNLRDLVPGSIAAENLKTRLIERGMWSQYLEVGIGPDAEIFTKAPVLSSVGTGADAGIHPKSAWNNPEPEVVLVVGSDGRIRGATLGNDVNLRDVEGRSALLLGKAKDNNASAAIGPFIRFFDGGFGLDDLRALSVSLRVEGVDGFVMEGASSMQEISRDPVDLTAQAINDSHQYPDGLALYCGTMFAPVKDRDAPGMGFTHHEDDVVTVRAPFLGSLTNRIRHSDRCERWTFGIRDLMTNLARRGLI